MRRILPFLLPLLLLLGCQPSATEKAISRQLQEFPETRVQDIYKNFCQDNLGPEHLIPDPDYARNYLRTELASFREDLDSLRYEAPERMYDPVGDEGNYVRVDLAVVLNGLVSEEALLDAFVRSAEVTSFVPETEDTGDYNLVRVKGFAFMPMSREEAILQMNLLGHNFFAFRDEDANGVFAVVYRRNDGDYGVIEDVR